MVKPHLVEKYNLNCLSYYHTLNYCARFPVLSASSVYGGKKDLYLFTSSLHGGKKGLYLSAILWESKQARLLSINSALIIN